MSAAEPSSTVRFGLFEADLAAGELRKRGRAVKLQGQPFQILAMLLRRPGEVVSREELQQALWPAGTFVEFEHGVNTAIRKIREALGDSADNPRFIETLPRKGYRFIAPVEVPMVPSPAVPAARLGRPLWLLVSAGLVGIARAPRPSLWPKVAIVSAALVLVGFLAWWAVGKFRRVARPTEIRSIAVLPFTDLSPAKDQQYFCDGVTEEITDALMQAEGLRVIGPQSAFQLRDKVHDLKSIQRQLNVTAAVHGSVRRAAARIRITAQLIDLTDGSLLWSETYERDSSDILAVQIGIARSIADRLQRSLPGWRNANRVRPRTVNPKAHELYLWGRHFWNLRTEEGIKKAIEYLEKAVAEDPAYGEAWSGLADAYLIAGPYSVLPPGEAFPKAKAAAAEALEIDDTLAEAHASLACLKFYTCDWSGIEQEFRRSIDLNPNYAFARQWHAEYLASSGRVSEALAESQRALELNPLSVGTWNSSGWVFVWARRYDEAIGRLRRSLDLERNSRPAHVGLGLAYMEKGMYPEAIRELRPLGDVPRALEILGSTYARAGRREEARRVIGRLRELSPDWPISAFVATIYADLGEPKLALEYLQKAANMPAVSCVWVANSTSLQSLRGDPRYHALLRKMGLEK